MGARKMTNCITMLWKIINITNMVNLNNAWGKGVWMDEAGSSSVKTQKNVASSKL